MVFASFALGVLLLPFSCVAHLASNACVAYGSSMKRPMNHPRPSGSRAFVSVPVLIVPCICGCSRVWAVWVV